jgi:hypothetical protein
LATNESVARIRSTSLLAGKYSSHRNVNTFLFNRFAKSSGIAFCSYVISLHKFVIDFFFILIIQKTFIEEIYVRGIPKDSIFLLSLLNATNCNSSKYESTVVLAHDLLIA